MPRGYSNYSFVVDSSFRPYSFSEMVQPLAIYKDAYEKSEAAYEDLSDKSDRFKYLSESLPEGSKARQIYEGYANELSKQAQDLAKHGLNMGNRRSLLNLKRRYQGEIGRLELADQAMQQEKQQRRQMNAKDSSMLYATDNLGIDDFLDNQTPNLYNISGNELYTRGAAAGRAASSRVYSAGDEGSTLNGYYRKWVERNGYSKESMDAFRANASAIPELQQATDAILQERGVFENLRENPQALQRARQSVLNGIIDGAVYQESSKPVKDEGVLSASERANNALRRQSLALQQKEYEDKRNAMYVTDPKTGKVIGVRPKSESGGGSGRSSLGKQGGTEHVTQLSKGLKISFTSGNPEKSAEDAKKYKSSNIENTNTDEHVGPMVAYDSLPANMQAVVDNIIKDGSTDMYDIYYKPHDASAWWGGRPELEIIPRDIKVMDNSSNDVELLQSMFGASATE